MTMTTSWDVFEDLRDVQDDLVRMSRMPGQWLAQFSSPLAAGYAGRAWAPALAITERKDVYLVTAEVPGVGVADLEVTFQDGLLTIQGERHAQPVAPGDKIHRAEGRYGAFRRSVTLPSHVRADKIEATTQDGVLRILVPKADEVQARHIQVNAGKGRQAVAATPADNSG